MNKTILLAMIFVIFFSGFAYAASKTLSVQVSATIPPRFDLNAEQKTEPSLNITSAGKKSGADMVRMEIETVSNLSEPYQISQHIKTVDNKNGGAAVYFKSEPLTKNPSTIFISDKNGKAGVIDVEYKIKKGSATEDDSERTRLVYTLCPL